MTESIPWLQSARILYIFHMWGEEAKQIQGDSRFMDITAGDDNLGLCDQKSLYKHVSAFEWLRSYGRLTVDYY